jgi:zinc-ribbon domain/Domain of unknown function (DUF4352)
MGDEVRTCPECGAENAANAKFCSQCATSLATTQQREIEALEAAAVSEPTGPTEAASSDAAREAPGVDPSPHEPAAPTAKKSFAARKTALLLSAGVVLLAVVVGIAAAVAISSGSTEPTRTSASATTDTQPAQTNPVNEDTDGDGTPDADDGAPYDANTTIAPSDDDDFGSAPSADDEDYLDDAEEETAHTTVQVGEPAVDDDVTFKVLSLEAVSSIATDEFSDGPITAKPGAKLVKAVVRWKNNMSKSADIFCGGSSAILLDQNDRNFDPIDDQIDIAGNNICGEDVQPGFTQTVTLAFQMPKDSNTAALALWNSDSEDDYDGQQTDVIVVK